MRFEPMLARADNLPRGDYAYEVKWDGFRAIVSMEDGLRIWSRRGWEMTERLTELQGMPDGLLLDGELIVFGDDGRPSFPLLSQRVLHGRDLIGASLMIFDVLRVDGMDAMCLSPSGEHDSSQALPTQRIGQTRAATGMSQTAISRIWRAFALKPHQVETFQLSPDPQFIDKVRDIVGLYLNPPEAAVVLCVDEKSQIQALDRSAPVLPLLPGCRRGRPMTTSATAPPTSTPRSMSPLGR